MPGWEVVLQNVDSVAFSYFDGAGTPVTSVNTAAKKQSIRRVEFLIKLRKQGAEQDVKHEIVGGAFLSMIL
jgi:hypothetical protein